jgi:hypothetical protein
VSSGSTTNEVGGAHDVSVHSLLDVLRWSGYRTVYRRFTGWPHLSLIVCGKNCKIINIFRIKLVHKLRQHLRKGHGAPCVSLVIDDNPCGLMVVLRFSLRMCP